MPGLHLFLPLLHRHHHLIDFALDAAEQLPDLLGRGRGPLCQLTNFISHHGKSAPLLARPRRLDGGIEGQQIGLLGNLANHIHDAADIRRAIGQPARHLTGTIKRPGNCFKLGARLLQPLNALLRLAQHGLGNLGGMIAVLCHQLHAHRDLLDRRRGRLRCIGLG